MKKKIHECWLGQIPSLWRKLHQKLEAVHYHSLREGPPSDLRSILDTLIYIWPPTQSFLSPISKKGKYFAKVVARGSSKLADLLHIWTILVGNPQKLIFLYIAIQRYIFFNLFHVESLTYLFDQTKPMQYSLVNKNQNSSFRLLNVQ